METVSLAPWLSTVRAHEDFRMPDVYTVGAREPSLSPRGRSEKYEGLKKVLPHSH
jgi:hypothetical protein